MKTIMTTAVLSLALAGAPAFAQSMGQGYDMLIASLESELASYGYTTEQLDGLRLSQIAELRLLFDQDSTPSQSQVDVIIANPGSE
ncbi:hypothetical protein [Jannaschia aquimarina]|uniref:Uncharacterized protein n=1 Tax=Jannaschia aquimarina TaxID=935700 RepID=A0A0D1EBR1_9RHOB|nr:hypothetical protein [Jannaschia aquimarina]KIT15174.1 hypothetical protein jaqu_31010 [Jannaschia aquimarina]SNT44855.1 hypothetical protein SAMN05421775_1301 [Jannaschia aquimarina]